MRGPAILILCAAALPWLAVAEPPPGYRLAFADEFDGARLDTGRWNYRTDSRHWSTQKPENVSVADGNLVLTLRKETAGGMSYTGAGVISKERFGFGYYEARFRVLAGKGWHSSFWMMKHRGPGAPATETGGADIELDVIENDSVNLNSYGVNVHRWKGEHISVGHKNIATPSLAEYHVYGCLYTPEQVTYFFDGKPVQTVDISSLPKGDLNIWLTSIASFLGKTDRVDDTRLPGRVEFDYARYYRQPD